MLGTPPETLSRDTWDKLVRCIRARIGCSQSAEDIAQETVLAGLQQGNLSESYLFGIARHKISAHFRENSRALCSNTVLDPERIADDNDPHAYRATEQREADLHLQIKLLPAASQVLVDSVLQDGANKKQIAANLSLSHTTVRKRWSRILQALRSAMGRSAATLLVAIGVGLLQRPDTVEAVCLDPGVANALMRSPGDSIEEPSLRPEPRSGEPMGVERMAPTCEKDERLAHAARVLASRYGQHRSDVDDRVASGPYNPEDWSDLRAGDEEIERLISALPGRFALHFPPGRPFPGDDAWPTTEIRSHLIDQVRGFGEVLREAKQIVVIGRASPDGSATTNHSLTLRRIGLVNDLIQEVIDEGFTETERAHRGIPIRSFALPNDKPIEPQTYRQTYLLDPGGKERPGAEPLVTWDDQSLQWFKRALADEALLRATDSRDWQALYGAINRVVLVIPIPCLGD
jgi:RNA polymerase sigma factor (sigma-70 family)